MNINRLPRAADMIRDSAPLDVVRVVFPAGFDPSFSGWPAPVGTWGVSAAGDYAWLKYGAGLTAWRSASNVATVAALASKITQLNRTVALEYPVANDFDPTVTGMYAPVGARATTLDGSNAWLKIGVGDSEWLVLLRIREEMTTGPASVSAVDLNVSVPMDCGVDVVWTLYGTGTSGGWVSLRLNGATAAGPGYSTLLSPWDEPVGYYPMAVLSTGHLTTVRFRLGASVSNYRMISGDVGHSGAGARSGLFAGKVRSVAALASVGLSCPGNYVAVGSRLSARVIAGGQL